MSNCGSIGSKSTTLRHLNSSPVHLLQPITTRTTQSFAIISPPLFFSLLTNPSYPFFDGNQEVVRATLKNILVVRKQKLSLILLSLQGRILISIPLSF